MTVETARLIRWLRLALGKCPDCGHPMDLHTPSVDQDDPFELLKIERGEYPVTCSECDCTYEEGQQ